MTRFYFNCDDGDIFDDHGADLIPIDAETQAEAEAKLLAEPGLIGVRNIDDFDVRFRLRCQTDTSTPSATTP